MHRLVAVAQDEEAERQRCRWPLGGALIGFLLCVAGWVVVDAVAAPFQNFSGFIFALLMTFEGGALYSGWLTLWYGIPLVVLSVPSAWRNVVQGAVLLLLWLGSLFYFIPASSGLMSIVERTSGWIVFAAAIVGLLGFMLGVQTDGMFRLPVRPLLVAVAFVFVLCFMTKNEITRGPTDEYGYEYEYVPDELSDSNPSPEERAYLHYLLYSAVAVGSVLLARRPGVR